MKPFEQGIQRAVSLLLVLMLSAMVALTFTDVVGRRLFNTPVFGANDITEHLMALIVFAGLPLLTARRGHLSIDLFDTWLLRPGWERDGGPYEGPLCQPRRRVLIVPMR